MAMTLDGFLPDEDHPLMQWVMTDRHGFPYWRERSSFDLPVGYPMISLIRKREDNDVPFFYLAEITGIHKMPLLQALLLYGIVDEWVVYPAADARERYPSDGRLQSRSMESCGCRCL